MLEVLGMLINGPYVDWAYGDDERMNLNNNNPVCNYFHILIHILTMMLMDDHMRLIWMEYS